MAPYAGAPVTQKFRERWMSVKHIGSSKPVAMVEIRRGRLNRSFHPYPGLGYPAFGDYPGALGIGFWYPDWQVNSPWMTLDGVQNIRLEQSFANNGITTCTIKMDNQALVPTTGPAGILYHAVEKGYYSPLRGFVGKGRPNPGVKKTPFFGKLPYAQIRIRQGYGADQMVTTFLGLIDDVESDSIPNQMIITARDMGGVLVDEYFFGWAKEMVLPSPLTFAPRRLAENHLLVGGGAKASSSQPGSGPDGVVKGEGAWRSGKAAGPENTQWIEITVPAGKYSNIFVSFPYEGMRVYFGIKPTRHNGAAPTYNGEPIPANTFFNPNGTVVPGDEFGGWPYFSGFEASKRGPGHYVSLGGSFGVGNDTIIRLGFRDLAPRDGAFEAGVNRFSANQRHFTPLAIAGRYVVIDDVADIVKCCLRWCGFKGWEVEDTGVNLQEPFVADPSMTFMDVINTIKDMVGYTFFIGEPRDDNNDQDLGYPIFRNNRVYENYTGRTEFIDDSLLLTDAKVKFTNQPDKGMIRCRGIAKNDGVTIDGAGGDIKRIMFAYIPPWAGEQSAKVAGVIKSLTHTDDKFTRVEDCQFGCYLIALQIALAKYTAILPLPANPGIGLDTLQSVIDRTQGLNSRIYVTNRTQEMQFGNNGFWTMELGGALVDTPDVDGVLIDYNKAIQILDRGGKNPWLRKRNGKTLPYGYQDT